MSLTLSIQFRLAEAQPDFTERISAACFTVAVAAFGLTPLTDPTKQAQRIALANAIVRAPTYATRAFGWVCVSRQAVNVESDLTDAFLTSTITASFDVAAQQLINPPVVTP